MERRRIEAALSEQPRERHAGRDGLLAAERVQGRIVLALQPPFAVPGRLAVTDEEEAPRAGGAQCPPSLTAISGAAGFFMPTT
jgi:hypothetical protein